MKKTLLTVVALLGSLMLRAAEGEGIVEETVVTGSLAGQTLDLSERWSIVRYSDIGPISYSALGWATDGVDNGWTVRLFLVPCAYEADGSILEDASKAVDLVSGLTDRGTFSWTPANLQKSTYVLVHEVKNGSTVQSGQTLRAYFDFTECTDVKVSREEIVAAAMGVSQVCSLDYDETQAWRLIGAAGDGVRTPTGLAADATSSIMLSVMGDGSLSGRYQLSGGRIQVIVDGVARDAIETGTADWTDFTYDLTGVVAHTVEFRFVSDGADASEAAFKGLSWQLPDTLVRAETEEPSAVALCDLREGLRAVRNPGAILPFVFSSTNFVGKTGLTAASLASVRVVRIEGEGDEYATWAEVPDTAKVLQGPTAGESLCAKMWRGSSKGGIWKAEFTVTTDNAVKHTETAFFDLRNFSNGLVIMLR